MTTSTVQKRLDDCDMEILAVDKSVNGTHAAVAVHRRLLYQ
jgi:hypothetical protein